MLRKSILFTSIVVTSFLVAPVFAAAKVTTPPVFSEYWCGPDDGCGGQSKDFSDVSSKANHVFVAFALCDQAGHAHFNLTDGVTKNDFIHDIHAMQQATPAKKVVLSVGGQGADWAGALNHPKVFTADIFNLMKAYDFDGVDLDIESSSLATADQAQQLTTLVHELRAAFNQVTNKHLLITVTPESTTVVNTVGVIGGGWNAMVPVVNNAIDDLDFIQVQEYNDDPYGDPVGTQAFLQHIYTAWHQPFKLGVVDYHGAPAKKLVMGILASTQAGISSYYVNPEDVQSTIQTLKNQNSDFGGVMMWDSHWDAVNSYSISHAVGNAL